jgi:TfoX/Sxy family transcriptional regulator of competence genes
MNGAKKKRMTSESKGGGEVEKKQIFGGNGLFVLDALCPKLMTIAPFSSRSTIPKY